MTDAAVRARLGAVASIIQGVERIGRAGSQVGANVDRDARRVLASISEECQRRSQDNRRAARELDQAMAALRACEENCASLEHAVTAARHRKTAAEQRLAAGEEALRRASDATSTFNAQQRRFSDALVSFASPAARAAQSYLEELRNYLSSPPSSGSPGPASGSGGGLPVGGSAITSRSSPNRIDLADDCHESVANSQTYGGYLDVVMHGDESGTQADISGDRIDFTMNQTASMIRESPSWGGRPIRLMSCSTGRAGYAQTLADEISAPVYAPSDILQVRRDGSMFVANGGSWRRFEPSQGK